MPKRAAAEPEAGPKSDGVRSIRRYGRHTSEEQRRECNEASAPGHSIQRAAQHSSKEQHGSAMQAEVERMQSVRNVSEDQACHSGKHDSWQRENRAASNAPRAQSQVFGNVRSKLKGRTEVPDPRTLNVLPDVEPLSAVCP